MPRTTRTLNSKPLVNRVVAMVSRRVAAGAKQNVLIAGMSATTGTTLTIHSSATELKNAAVAKLVHMANGNGSPRIRHRTIPIPKANSHIQTSAKRPVHPNSTSQVKWLFTSVR